MNNKYTWLGAPFQLSMCALFVYHVHFFKSSSIGFVEALSTLGMIVFAYCLYILYMKNWNTKGLRTTGVFKYTRHPMYTGLLMADCTFWNSANVGPHFWPAMIGFVLCMTVAAYFQERETLARFGDSTREYYSKTPRIFLFYPIRKYILL